MSCTLRRIRTAGGTASVLRLAVLVFSLVVLLLGACKDNKPRADTQPPAVVPPPAGLLADVFLATPDTTWQRVRGKLGGPASLLPSTFPTLVVTLLGLPPAVAEQVDAALPAYGAALETVPGGEADLVLAVHLRDEARVIELLTKGPDARYELKKDSSGVQLIEPKVKAPDTFAAMGLVNHYLIASKTPAALMMGAQYVTRTLPTLPKPAVEITAMAGRTALAGPLAARLRREWTQWKKAREADDKAMREKHGREPDFGDPAAALADIDGKVRRLIEVMGDLSQARFEVTSDESGIHTRVAMVPQAGDGLAAKEIGALVVGDTVPMMDLPASSVVALLTRDSEEVRKASAQDQTEGLGHILGERITTDDRKKVGDVLEDWARARGDWLVAGVEWGPETRSLLVRGALKDAPAFEKAMAGLLDLPRVAGLKEPLERFAGVLTVSKPTGEGTMKLVHVRREVSEGEPETKGNVRKRRKADVTEFDVVWEADSAQSVFRVMATSDAKAWFAAQGKAKPPKIGEDPDLADALKALGNEAAFVFLFQPFKIMPMNPKAAPAKPGMPVVFAYGRSKSDGWFRLDLPYTAASELIRGAMGR
jgi:hypothetical protein